MRTLSLLMRGVIADNAQAIHDANAVTILRQQIREAAGAVATARRELAVAMAYHAAEARALDAIDARIETLSDGARRALADGRADLGSEAAIHIAALVDERSDRQSRRRPLRRRDRAAEAPGRAGRRPASGPRPRPSDRPDHRGAATGGDPGAPGHGLVGGRPR
ncbi:PspA/IM30 family protein [Methylobacterium sp. WL1]|uniref:PspA/IM30 family protein n=1 Tax=Methylobacterium sp. WL1 TaxID=2603276 RepID=UPI001FEE7FCD|nr:PspA/IM30 family protein [Methylobacterium sp. WL1]